MRYEEFLERLGNTRPSRDGHTARCPAHNDNVASLSVSAGRDRTLVYCHAGCSFHDIMDAMGLDSMEVWYDRALYQSQPQQPVGKWHYFDEERNHLFTVLKFVTPDGGKRFSQYRVVDGQIVWNRDGIRMVPYKLPDLLMAETERKSPVYIVEGEKDADRLLRAGHMATTFAGGAGSFLPQYVKYFLFLDVVIIADKDEAGYKHAKTILDSLEGIATSVRVVESKTGKDVSDHLDAGHDLKELVQIG